MAKILIICGLLCFVLATFGTPIPLIALVPLGLAFVTAAKLV